MPLRPHRRATLSLCRDMEAAATIPPPQLLPQRPAIARPLIVGRPATVRSLHILDMDNSLLLLHPPGIGLTLFFIVPQSIAMYLLVTDCNLCPSAATVLAASSPLDMSRARIPSSLSKTPILNSSREDTRANKEATDSRAPTASREDINKLLPSSNRLRLPATPHLLGPTDSPLLASTDSRPVLEEAMARQTINHPVSMVSLLVIAWQRLSYTNVRTLVAQFFHR